MKMKVEYIVVDAERSVGMRENEKEETKKK